MLCSLHTTARQAGRRFFSQRLKEAHMATTDSTSSVDVATLRHAIRGSVLAPGDDGWDEARTPWNVAFDQHPALIVVPANSADVQAAVRFATANGLRVAPQSSGHGVAIARRSLRRACSLRMHELRDVEIDVEAQQARVGAGAIWEDVVSPAAEHGFAVLHGSSPDVGVAGYTLGGGMGWLARKHGLAANSADGDRAGHGRRRVPPRRPHPRARPLLRAARRRRQLRRRDGVRVQALPARDRSTPAG